jgi:hypothetical protein
MERRAEFSAFRASIRRLPVIMMTSAILQRESARLGYLAGHFRGSALDARHTAPEAHDLCFDR